MNSEKKIFIGNTRSIPWKEHNKKKKWTDLTLSLKSSGIGKTVEKVKRQVTHWEKIFIIHISDR